MNGRMSWAALAVIGMASVAAGAEPKDRGKAVAALAGVSVPQGNAASALAGCLRGILLECLPDPVYEGGQGWGNTKRGRNHGTWRKVRVTGRNVPQSVSVEVRDVRKPEEGRTTFAVIVGLDAGADYQQQKWSNGVRLYDASVRARFHVRLALQCEMILRVQKTAGLLPDAVFRLRVLRSDVRFDHVVWEHIAGFGGTTAKVAGDLLLAGLRKVHPSLERRLLDRANAAILKAGDTKEVRIGLGKLLKADK
jgi:hypothetical protein